jgi:hypothetical protein
MDLTSELYLVISVFISSIFGAILGCVEKRKSLRSLMYASVRAPLESTCSVEEAPPRHWQSTSGMSS